MQIPHKPYKRYMTEDKPDKHIQGEVHCTTQLISGKGCCDVGWQPAVVLPLSSLINLNVERQAREEPLTAFGLEFPDMQQKCTTYQEVSMNTTTDNTKGQWVSKIPTNIKSKPPQ